MNVLWSQDKLLKIFSTESVMVNASGDCGSTPAACCRLCGGGKDLKQMEATHEYDGVEEHYDRMLFECFGVEVHQPGLMICERCVYQLRNVQKFRDMVQNAFNKPLSESSDGSKIKILTSYSDVKFDIEVCQAKRPAKINRATEGSQKRCELRRDRKRTLTHNMHVETKKANVACSVCNQRYPMIVPFDGVKKFVCSRCKKNADSYGICKKCNARVSMNLLKDHMKSHMKGKPKGLNNLQKIPPLLTKTTNLSRTETYVKYPKKYECSQCQKKYFVPQNLAAHISVEHGDSLDCKCSVCGKDMKTRDLLYKHMRIHTGEAINQCNICMKTFKSQSNLQTHYLIHKKR